MKLEKHNQTHQTDDFILGWYIDTDVCDKIIEYFEKSEDKIQGVVDNGVEKVVKEHVKKSTDAVLRDKELLSEYGSNLQQVFDEYIKIFPMVNHYDPWGVTERVNIQRYYPKEGFFSWHTERGSCDNKESNRNMVFMTYLNNVKKGGETEFYHQNLKVKPERGLTLVWPADWTYTHRGCVSETETKYIVTGWTSYYHKG